METEKSHRHQIARAKKVISSSDISVLLMLSVATSIDALAVGLSFSFLKFSIVTPAIAIGVITFFLF